jgi:hypothetical protein
MQLGNVTIGGQVYAVRVVDAIKIDGEAVEVYVERQSLIVTTTLTCPLTLHAALLDEVGLWARSRAVPMVGAVD